MPKTLHQIQQEGREGIPRGFSVPAATGQADSVQRIALRLAGDKGDAVHRLAGLLALPRDVSRPAVLRGLHMLLREVDDVPVHPGSGVPGRCSPPLPTLVHAGLEVIAGICILIAPVVAHQPCNF